MQLRKGSWAGSWARAMSFNRSAGGSGLRISDPPATHQHVYDRAMALLGWDLSHYDQSDSRSAVAEGIAFFTHKAGGDAPDAELGPWWAKMKDFRPDVLLGAYWVLYPGSPFARADAFLARLDSQCPGWRDGPFILQVDCEIWGGDRTTAPGKADIRAFCDRLVSRMPKLAPIVYAPKWVYGETLAGLGYPLWASAYVAGAGKPASLYPGDSSSKWAAYSGQVPAILQFTSSATIGGQTTCDANAYRGTLDQLTALVAPGWADDMTFTDAQMQAFPWQYKGGGVATPGQSTLGMLTEVTLAVRAQKLRDEALLAAIRDDQDVAAILDRIDTRAAELAADVAQVDEQVWAKVPDPGVSAEEKAALLKAVLGADAAAVGRLLAGS